MWTMLWFLIREKRAEIREMKKRKAQKKKERLQVQQCFGI